MSLQYQQDRTVCAIATAQGPGSIAVIRISGSLAFSIANKIFSKNVENLQSHTAHYGIIFDPKSKKKIDDVLLLIMRGKKSFTGEDTVEIHCHGGNLIPKKVLELCLQAGALPALPGEFSFKAFMNGKIDLAQAEAIQGKIHSLSDLAAEVSQEQMEGKLSKKVAEFQKKLTHFAAIFEAWVDFPEEGLEFSSFEETTANIVEVKKEIEALIETYSAGKIIREGIAVSIVGAPNVGKSSLLNALVDKEHAIVSDIAGTTRDVVEADLRINGLHLKFLDTAGIRLTDDLIEKEGIRRSRKALEQSDLILFVVDATAMNMDGIFLEDFPKEKTILCVNKIDLVGEKNVESLLPDFEWVVELSAKNGIGLDRLHSVIDNLIWKGSSSRQEEVTITNERHKNALGLCSEALQRVLDGLENEMSSEFISFDMRQALFALSQIIGSDVTDDIIDAVFSSFCIGK